MQILAQFLILNLAVFNALGFSKSPYKRTCETLTVPGCVSAGYNTTIFPNRFDHESQLAAAAEYNNVVSRLSLDCSPDAKLFLCSVLFPICSDNKSIDPCRDLCEDVMTKCRSSIPEPLKQRIQCKDFPESNGGTSFCIAKGSNKQQEHCPDQMRADQHMEFKIRFGVDSFVPNCGIPCGNYYFSSVSYGSFPRVWIGFWSAVCALSTLFTVLTFIIDRKRFQYPERPIVFMSACYLVISVIYLAGIILDDRASSTAVASGTSRKLVVQGTKYEPCIVLFMLLYFFSMASSIWWVVLTVTWYLAAKCHWAHEAIARNSQYLHFGAWALPAAQTIGILAWGKVDGDPLSGVCFTGLTEPLAMKIFLIAPLSAYLVVGTGFLVAGFVSLLEIRSIIKSGGTKTDSLEKLIRRIGIFSLFYIVPAVVVIGCYIHEASVMDDRVRDWFRREACPLQSSHPVCQDEAETTADYVRKDGVTLSSLENGPSFTPVMQGFVAAMVKYLMTLIVGVTSGLWIWTGKTLVSWRNFFGRLCGLRPVPTTPTGGKHCCDACGVHMPLGVGVGVGGAGHVPLLARQQELPAAPLCAQHQRQSGVGSGVASAAAWSSPMPPQPPPTGNGFAGGMLL